MVAGDSWRHLVPDPVGAVIDEIGGVERLQESTTDDG